MVRKSFKIRENIKRKWEARSIRRKQEVSSQNGRVGISLEFPCNFFFSWNQSAPDMFFWNLKSQMICPLLPLFTCLCNQIGKWLKKPGRRAYSVSRATKDLSSEPWCKSQWKTGFFTYWFSFEFSYIVCLLLFLTFLIQMITLIESTKNWSRCVSFLL